MKRRWLLLATALAGCPALAQTPPAQGALVPLVVVTGAGRGSGELETPLSIAVSAGGPALREQWLKAQSTTTQTLEALKTQRRSPTTARQSAPERIVFAGGR